MRTTHGFVDEWQSVTGVFLFVLSATVLPGERPHLVPSQFVWLFVFSMTGIVAGALLAGRMVARMVGRVEPLHRIRDGFLVKGRVLIANLPLDVLFVPEAWQAILLVAPCSLGWATMAPVVP